MSDRQVLHELARTLSESERKKLLNRIHQSINMDDDTEKNVYKKTVETSNRDAMIRNEMENISFFMRIKLWFKKIFSGKDPQQLFLQIKLNQYKRKVQQKTQGLISFETRSFQPGLAEKVFALYLKTLPLIRLYRDLWNSSEKFEQILYNLVHGKIEDSRKNLQDFLTIDEMELLYSRSGSKNVLRERLTREIDAYVADIDDTFFDELEQNVQPVFYLKEIVLFPFNDFFKLFKIAYSQPDNKPIFKNASAVLSLDLLEHLYYGAYLVSKVDRSHEIDTVFMEQIHSSLGEDDQEIRDDLKERSISDHINDIIKETLKLLTSVPLVDIIRFYREDPYYQLIFYIPQLNLRDFYLSKLHLEILPLLDDIFPEVRERVIKQKIAELFPESNLEPLLYYRDYTSMEYDKIGLPTFSYTRSIQLMYNFIKQYYRKKVQSVIQIVSTGILRQNRITLNRLLVHSSAIEDLQDKIKTFDDSLSTDEDDGKLFQRIRHSIATEVSHQRLYRSLLQQKDNEVKSLLAKGKDGFEGVKKVFRELLDSTMDAVKQRLQTLYYLDSSSKTLKSILEDRCAHIEKFQALLTEMEKVERRI